MNLRYKSLLMIGLISFFSLNILSEVKAEDLPPPPISDTTIFDTIGIGNEVITYCLDTTELSAPVDTMYNICIDTESPSVSFVLLQNNCIKYQGFECGTDTACIVLCDTLNNCDTTYFVISALNAHCYPEKTFYYDTLFVGLSKDYCPDASALTGDPVSIINDCPQSSGANVDFTLNPLNYCLNYAVSGVGTDTACIIIEDNYGFQDTTCVIITGKLPTTEYICDTIELGTNKMYCLVNEELDGNIIDMHNSCPELSGDAISTSMNQATLCFDVFGQNLGTDTLCIVLCDEFDICDTTVYKITVIETPDTNDLEPPVAVKDSVTTQADVPIYIDVLSNDTIPGRLTILEVISDPSDGLYVVLGSSSILYSPNKNFCDLDSLEYRICNDEGCDTARVCITVECNKRDSIVVYTGISPDGDQINDSFTIEGIEDYPNNIVKVYNRWGNMVFNSKGYRNTWLGDWNGKTLPTGTYFYLIDLGEGTELSGYLQIN